MAEFRTCPACGASVKLENVERHVRRAHPQEKVDFGLSQEERETARGGDARVSFLARRERWVYPLVAVALVVAVVLAVVLVAPSTPTEPGPETAPLFTLPTTEGEAVSLADLRTEVLLLEFMDPHCGVCQQETEAVLVPLHLQYGDRVVFLSVVVDWVAPDNDVLAVESFKSFFGANWTYVVDDNGTVWDAYREAFGFRGTPSTLVLRPGLVVEKSFPGATRYENLAGSLERALGE